MPTFIEDDDDGGDATFCLQHDENIFIVKRGEKKLSIFFAI